MSRRLCSLIPSRPPPPSPPPSVGGASSASWSIARRTPPPSRSRAVSISPPPPAPPSTDAGARRLASSLPPPPFSLTGSAAAADDPPVDLPPDFLPALRSSVPPRTSISTNPYDLDAHGRGESYHPPSPPRAVVTPGAASDVPPILRLCSDFGVPVVPYGAGTSVEGHVHAVRGGISLDVSRLDSIDLPDGGGGTLDDSIVRVGAGATRGALNRALRHTGLRFTVDPGADATIGGMAACGASGTSAVKYGTMRENVLGLECALPDGTVAKCGTDALKSSAGYDLTSLMVGSEGTLGVITSVTVRLHPVPQFVSAAVCSFDTLHRAAEAVAAMRMCGVDLERCELLDGTSVEAFNAWRDYRGPPMDARPTLFLEFAGPTEVSVSEHVRLARSVCSDDYGGSDFRFADGEEGRRNLWRARHGLYYASIALRRGATGAVVTDACAPLSKFADLISRTAEDVRESGVVGPCFGHAGDGNFHCIMPLIDSDPSDYVDRVRGVNDALIARAIDAGGTCTGEHGVGYGKIRFLSRQYGEGGVDMMRRIKRALDPKNIMNPGKVVIV